MALNFLEQFTAEWYEFQGYFVRRNIPVGRRPKGGYETELDVVAFHPQSKHLVQVEPSMDADSWTIRERRYQKKFELGRQRIPEIFSGLVLPDKIEQIALLGFGGQTGRPLGGGHVLTIADLMSKVRDALKDRKVESAAVPEQFVILRSLQFASQYW